MRFPRGVQQNIIEKITFACGDQNVYFMKLIIISYITLYLLFCMMSHDAAVSIVAIWCDLVQGRRTPGHVIQCAMDRSSRSLNNMSTLLRYNTEKLKCQKV